MKINARIDVLQLVNETAKAQRNLVYSTQQGINETAKQIRDAMQAKVKAKFTLRSARSQTGLPKQAAIISTYAKVSTGTMFAEIKVGTPKGILLAGFEDGITRDPAAGKRVLAAPVLGGAERPSFSAPIPAAFRFKAIALKPVHAKGVQQKPGADYKGKQHTFTIAGVGVFQRVGSGRDRAAVKMVYAYMTKQKLPAMLGFQKTASDIADKWLSENITQAFLRSLPRRP